MSTNQRKWSNIGFVHVCSLAIAGERDAVATDKAIRDYTNLTSVRVESVDLVGQERYWAVVAQKAVSNLL